MKGLGSPVVRDVLILVNAFLFLFAGFILMGIMNILPLADNNTRAVILLSLIVIMVGIAQLVAVSQLFKIRERLEVKKR